MKFEIKSLKDSSNPIEEIYPSLKSYKFKSKAYRGLYWTWYWGEVEIDSAEELMELMKSLNKPLVIGALGDDSKENIITIYDDYLE